MRKVAIAFAATIALLVTGVLAWNAQAADQGGATKPPKPCKPHTTQADCSADKACTWDTTKNKCMQVK
jgi:hypothetical protein